MKQYKFLFSLYLSFLLILILFFLASVHNISVNNAMAEWVINYQGGFTRRGFLGEGIFQIIEFSSLPTPIEGGIVFNSNNLYVGV